MQFDHLQNMNRFVAVVLCFWCFCRLVEGSSSCLDLLCQDLVGPNSYCKTWQNPPVCHGSSSQKCESCQGGVKPLECGQVLCRDDGACFTMCEDVFGECATGKTNVPTISPPGSIRNPWYAFTYTNPKTGASFFDQVESGNFKGVFVYGGDVEFYCRGMPTAASGGGASPGSLPCVFDGASPTAFVYYSDFARATAKRFHTAGLEVWITFDGRIKPASEAFVPDFSILTDTEIRSFAIATANLICNDPHIAGLSWDVEPFNNNQIPFFKALDAKLTSCGKKWNIFAFGEAMNEQMWVEGLGQSGFLLDSTYDLKGGRPCECVDPEVYRHRLHDHLVAVLKLGQQYNRTVMPLFSGAGSTQIYTSITTESCTHGDGIVRTRYCPYSMDDYAEVMKSVVESLGSLLTLFPFGAGIYDWTDTNNGGYAPTEPSLSVLQILTGIKQ